MGDFYPLTDVGEHGGVLTDDIASANSGKANALRIAFTGITFTRIHRALFQIAPQRAGNRLAHRQSRPRRSVYLMTMMRFNNLNIGIVAHHLRGFFQQF
ncbi:hypothetical protein D3C71_1653560 [compost metagenome]